MESCPRKRQALRPPNYRVLYETIIEATPHAPTRCLCFECTQPYERRCAARVSARRLTVPARNSLTTAPTGGRTVTATPGSHAQFPSISLDNDRIACRRDRLSYSVPRLDSKLAFCPRAHGRSYLLLRKNLPYCRPASESAERVSGEECGKWSAQAVSQSSGPFYVHQYFRPLISDRQRLR